MRTILWLFLFLQQTLKNGKIMPMEDTKPISQAPISGAIRGGDHAAVKLAVSGRSKPSKPSQIQFNRKELDVILSLYGRRVAEGEWRDYAVDFLKDVAVFSVFRRSSEMPLYRIEKNPKLARRQGAYSVLAPSGLILKRGHDLRQVLKVLEAKKLKVVK
jgi:hypothetical protein